MTNRLCTLILAGLAGTLLASPLSLAAQVDDGAIINKPPSAKDWADLAKLPDWSGSWNPDQRQQTDEIKKSPTPWNAKAGAMIAKQQAEARAGNPRGLFMNCLPEGMPTWMMISHNALEFMFTPGRVTLLGEMDGNRIRRIYTDGRKHPADPDLSFHGHSIGHWEGETLVIDTVGITPESLIAITEDQGIPNNGDMHIAERIHIVKPDTISDDMVITAPHVLTKPWTTSRVYYRQRARRYDIIEGVCRQGDFISEVDKNGDHVWAPAPKDTGITIPK